MHDRKKFFLVSEVSKMSGFSLTQLYYYEKIGVVVPERDPENGYRKYSMADIHSLILLRDLLNLNMPLSEIKKYFEKYNTAGTIEMMNEAINALHKQIVRLYRIRDSITDRLNAAATALRDSESREIILKDYPDRHCLKVCDEEVPIANIDAVIMKYLQDNHLDLSMFNMHDCYTLDTSTYNEYGAYRYKNIFLYSPTMYYPSNYVLPAGKYLSLTYRGGAENSTQYLPKMLRYAKEHRLRQTGDPIEFCLIDEYFTEIDDEFVIMVQIPVEEDPI